MPDLSNEKIVVAQLLNSPQLTLLKWEFLGICGISFAGGTKNVCMDFCW